MKMRYRILILIALLAGGYYVYEEFADWTEKPPVDTAQQEQADRVRDLIR
jgi:CRISPR/Cas system-associated protein Csm6